MFRFNSMIALISLIPAAQIWAQSPYQGIGRAATPAEIKSWDIDVRPDFKGLPVGRGSVAKGQEIWETKCESCHGAFGESGEVFTPISGGISKQAIASGRVESLIDGKTPIRSTMMKVATVSTLWDYINRAMPWNAPKSLTVDEVYASVAYVLHLNDVLPSDFELSNDNIAAVQLRMPNRNGMTTNHGLLTPRGTPDVAAVACMKDCISAPQVSSTIPEYAKNAHGNLAEQTRGLGLRGITTSAATGKAAIEKSAIPAAQILFNASSCNACHAAEQKTIGPSITDLRTKYASRADAAQYLAAKIKTGGSGVWGVIPMPPQAQLTAQELLQLGKWLSTP